MAKKWIDGLRPETRAMYDALLFFVDKRGGCEPSYELLSIKVGKSAGRVAVQLKNLEESNIITIVRRFKPDGTTPLRNFYVLHDEVNPTSPQFADYKRGQLAKYEHRHGRLPKSIRRTPFPTGADAQKSKNEAKLAKWERENR